jgi:hypothetical protein
MTSGSSDITRRRALAGALGFVASSAMATYPAFALAPTIIVHKDPNCGCCSGWVRHLEVAGFTVKVDETPNLQGVRGRLGVPTDLAACHTAEAGGYVIEGHVPAAALRRLLQERPDAIGVAVPGMPAGSPGMGGAPQRYQVVLFGANGRRSFMQFSGADVVDEM